MRRTVDLNAEFGSGAVEVENKRPDRMLAPKVQSLLIVFE
jgi:hypothetical protein